MKIIYKYHSKIDSQLLPIYEFIFLNRYQRVINHLNEIKKFKNIFSNIYYFLKIIFLNLFSIVYLPIIFLLLIFTNIRFLNLDMGQIGSVVHLDSIIKYNILKKKKITYILLIQKNYITSNNYLISLYKKKFNIIFIKSFLIRFFLLPICHSKLITDDQINFEYSSFSKAAESQVAYKKKFNKTIISIPKIDIIECEKYLKKINFNFNKFVSIHIRSKNFYNEIGNSFRNADLNTYLKSINYLKKRNYDIVIIDNYKEKLNENSNFDNFFLLSDVELKLKEKLNIYFLSKCSFHIATPSGASFISSLFYVPIFWTNVHLPPLLGFHDNNINIFKKFYNQSTQKFLNFNELFSPFLLENIFSSFENDTKIKLIDNTENEIYESLLIFTKNLENNNTQKNINNSMVKNFLKNSNWSRHTNGKYCELFLENYFKFLKGN